MIPDLGLHHSVSQPGGGLKHGAGIRSKSVERQNKAESGNPPHRVQAEGNGSPTARKTSGPVCHSLFPVVEDVRKSPSRSGQLGGELGRSAISWLRNPRVWQMVSIIGFRKLIPRPLANQLLPLIGVCRSELRLHSIFKLSAGHRSLNRTGAGFASSRLS